VAKKKKEIEKAGFIKVCFFFCLKKALVEEGFTFTIPEWKI
jgi:hypothetical protein